MFRNKVPFQKFKSDVPVIKLSLSSGVEFNALIDTGSESTVFDDAFVKTNASQFSVDDQCIMSLVGVSCDSVHTVKNVSVILTVDNKKLPVSGITYDLTTLNNNARSIYSSNITISAIIGCDMLKQFGAIIDFQKQSANFKL